MQLDKVSLDQISPTVNKMKTESSYTEHSACLYYYNLHNHQSLIFLNIFVIRTINAITAVKTLPGTPKGFMYL